jgi:hypothetical protein
MTTETYDPNSNFFGRSEDSIIKSSSVGDLSNAIGVTPAPDITTPEPPCTDELISTLAPLSSYALTRRFTQQPSELQAIIEAGKTAQLPNFGSTVITNLINKSPACCAIFIKTGTVAAGSEQYYACQGRIALEDKNTHHLPGTTARACGL